jgi:L-gulonate 5-dehydrogenase
MKALIYVGEQTLEYKTTVEPVVKEGDALIKVESVGICGSDMHAFLGHDDRRPAPLILGHEAGGTIIEGKNSGKRVTVNPLVACGTCPACKKGRNNICPGRQLISIPPRQGAFAEYLVIPESNILVVPEHVNISHAALTEPLACGWHAVKLGVAALDVPLTDVRCLIIGGGAIGVGVNLALKAKGAREVTMVDSNPLRYQTLVKNFRESTVVVKEIKNELDFDFIIDAVGYSKTREMACRLCKPGGVIAHIGLGDGTGGLDVRRMTLQEITFIGTYTYTSLDFEETAEAIFNSQMGDFLWIEERSLDQGQEAFVDILAGNVAASKVVLRP